MPERGKEYYNLFTETRLKKKDIPYYAPIKKNVIRGFRVVQRKESQKRKIMLMWIGEHLSMSSLPFQQHMKNDQSRESFEIFFLYCSFMFDRCNADRSVHDKSWNKLAEILMSTTNEEKTDTSKENTVYVVDLIALIPLVTAILKTFLHLVLKLITALPKGYQQFALVTDFSENILSKNQKEQRQVPQKR